MRFKHKTELKWLCECNYCGVEFADDETLNEHKKRHLNRPNFQCIECERVFTIKSGLKKHMPRHVSGHSNAPICPSNFHKFISFKFRILAEL